MKASGAGSGGRDRWRRNAPPSTHSKTARPGGAPGNDASTVHSPTRASSRRRESDCEGMAHRKIRTATPDDARAIAAIYAHYVETSAATFDEAAPREHDVAARIAAVTEAGLPFLVAEHDGAVAGYAY